MTSGDATIIQGGQVPQAVPATFITWLPPEEFELWGDYCLKVLQTFQTAVDCWERLCHIPVGWGTTTWVAEV